MISEPQALITDFVLAIREQVDEPVISSLFTHQLVTAPHASVRLPAEKCAVYVFSLRSDAKCPAGPNRVLKVGRVGKKSAPRFEYQHYSKGSANSTVAGAIENNRLLWSYLGIDSEITD